MPTSTENDKYRVPLCPYLIVGNRRVLVHLDSFCVPQSLYWPKPGLPDRLSWRDPLDEWPYWNEMNDDAVRARMPYFEYTDGRREHLHDATDVQIDYVEDSNVLAGHYALPGGAELNITTFVPPGLDVWIRRYSARGYGKLVLQSEFFEKAVRGHPGSHLGNINFRGAFDAAPRGSYVIMSDGGLPAAESRIELPVDGEASRTLFMSMADDLRKAAEQGDEAMQKGFDSLRQKTVAADRAWIAGARKPVAEHSFIRKNYKRWLLANILFTPDDGAMVCGARPFWGFAWPRDCSLQIAAYAAAGFIEEAQRVVQWHLDNTPESAIHEARYFPDRTPMLLDNRPRQGDNPGFLAWAAGFVCAQQWDNEWAESITPNLYVLAEHLVASRDAETLLPLPAADHRESEVAESLGVAVTAAAGLKGAAYVAEKLGDTVRAERYRDRMNEIRQAMERVLWDEENRYFMQSVKPLRAKTDISACWGAYPFAVWCGNESKYIQGVQKVFRERWNPGVGGVLAGAGTSYESYWQYYTSILLLGAAAIGDASMTADILSGLDNNVSPQGLVPEQVDRKSDTLWGCAPLPVAQSCLLLYAYSDLVN